jgi:transcriptional regulator with XRE-family HTH domain
MHFGEQLKKLRIELGLGQKEMADRLSIDVSTYSRWERKERPAMHVIERVNKVFRVQAIDWVREPEASAEEAPSTGPRVVHLKPENDATHADPNETERLRLFNRMLDFFERMFGKLGGGVATDCIPRH